MHSGLTVGKELIDGSSTRCSDDDTALPLPWILHSEEARRHDFEACVASSVLEGGV